MTLESEKIALESECGSLHSRLNSKTEECQKLQQNFNQKSGELDEAMTNLNKASENFATLEQNNSSVEVKFHQICQFLPVESTKLLIFKRPKSNPSVVNKN